MKSLARVLFAICGIAFGLAAFPVYGQQENSVEINKKPLSDFADRYRDQDLDWSSPFRVEMEGFITKQGKLDLSRTRFTKTEGDQRIIDATRDAIGAVGDSGWLGNLSSQGVSEIAVTVAQTSDLFELLLVMPLSTAVRAKTMASGFSVAVSTALLVYDSGTKKLGDNDLRLLKATTVTNSDKNVTIKIALPAKDFQEMVKNSLAPKAEVKTPSGK